MSIYYYGKLVGTYDLKQKNHSEPTLVSDIVRRRPDYDRYMSAVGKTKSNITIRHYQDA